MRIAIVLMSGILFLGGCNTDQTVADLIIHNANCYTVDKDHPWCEAIVITDGLITFAGSNNAAIAHAGPETKLIDGNGQFLMPGFIEGHGHFPGLGSSLQNLNFLKSKSWEEIVAAVAEKVKNAEPGEWIVGRGWHQEKWTESPARNVLGYPYHDALSLISPDNPVMLGHASGHGLFANKNAMDLAGVSLETADPRGGHVVRGDGGEAIGVFEENAQAIIREAYRQYVTTLSEAEITQQWYDGIELAEAECLSKGVTSFQDAGSSLEQMQRYKELAEKGELDLRLWAMIRHEYDYLHDKLAGYPIIDAGNGFFTCRAVKITVDGALGSYGAWLLDSYNDKPNFSGQNTSPMEQMRKLAGLCAEHGLQLCTHAIGDRANREVLDAFEAEFAKSESAGSDSRWRIEHAQHLHPDDIPRFAELGVIASMQGIHCTSDALFVEKRLGTERARGGAYAWRSLLESGAVVTNGTDAPVEDVNPIESFYATVTRKRADSGFAFFPEQKMTRQEAIYSYTMACAYAAFEEDKKGSIEVGKYADLVLLSNDLVRCRDDEILDTEVLLTIVGGEVKYEKG